MSKADSLKKAMGPANRTMDGGASRFDRVEKTIFGGQSEESGKAETRNSASEGVRVSAQEDVRVSEAPIAKVPPVKKVKITVLLAEEAHKAWKVKLATAGLGGQDVLEMLVLRYLEEGGD